MGEKICHNTDFLCRCGGKRPFIGVILRFIKIKHGDRWRDIF
jgi:hypothetical protein